MKDIDRILLAHGGGGALTRELIAEVLLASLGRNADGLPDAAAVPGVEGLVFTTDSFVVKPLFFRGGDIGSLSVHGTVNDLAVSGAKPVALSMGLIIEEGFAIDTLARIVRSAATAAELSEVQIVTGDTKVVARGEADQLFINTAGVGIRQTTSDPKSLKPGDVVLINGPIAEHGIAVMSEREGIAFDTRVRSDASPVWPFVKALIDAGVEPRVMRDPTRGGLAACCAELAGDSDVTIELDENAIPVRPETRAACEMLGLDPLTVANEGKLVLFVSEGQADLALDSLRKTAGGERSSAIGRVVPRKRVPCVMRTRFGGERILEMPYGEELPRIC
ncbi:MAG TPA: hydrogenase expression/formation protein HypE [Candidatus Hydrogenedentes bacterium]|nr:hydrogenase expression/formation protein HypE [Candidatus Hydrogenedentota bacterium]HQH53584.1 hydrogenase expression/formation protein HypE [Candidatus Hydrogenedentota bacterium]HQM48368.1 hydrogenase expression/formation protein HypE [Candidatus Hydrogenedentota bacterium]